jgi:hypothetical protein
VSHKNWIIWQEGAALISWNTFLESPEALQQGVYSGFHGELIQTSFGLRRGVVNKLKLSTF